MGGRSPLPLAARRYLSGVWSANYGITVRWKLPFSIRAGSSTSAGEEKQLEEVIAEIAQNTAYGKSLAALFQQNQRQTTLAQKNFQQAQSEAIQQSKLAGYEVISSDILSEIPIRQDEIHRKQDDVNRQIKQAQTQLEAISKQQKLKDQQQKAIEQCQNALNQAEKNGPNRSTRYRLYRNWSETIRKVRPFLYRQPENK